MKTPKKKVDAESPARKPQINLVLEQEEKEIFEQVAKARGNIGVSALVRLLVMDEARRLGIPTIDEVHLKVARYRKLLLLSGIDPDTELPIK